MKKKLLILLLLLSVFTLTACGNKEVKKADDNKEKIILKDDNIGAKTTFKYDKKEAFSNIKESTGGASSEITFENEDLDVEFQMYYNTMRIASYEDSKTNRSDDKYYKEYKFGKYEAYAYGDYSSGLYVIIKLDVDDNDMATLLFVSIDRLDTNEDVVVADVLKDDLKDFFNSIEFEKTK